MPVTDKKLEELELADEMESRKISIAQKKALIKEIKRKHGRDWKKVFGILKVNSSNLESLYSIDPSLRHYTAPTRRR